MGRSTVWLGALAAPANDGCLVGILDNENPLTSQTWLSRTAMATDIFMAGRVPNSYFADRDTQRTACAAGTFADPHLSQSTTSFCTLCPVGTKGVNPNPGVAASTSCSACAAGLHQDQLGQATCKGQRCFEGQYFEQTGQSSPVTCKVCPSGKFSDRRAETACKLCVAGQYQDQADKRECHDCIAGQYQDGAGAKECRLHRGSAPGSTWASVLQRRALLEGKYFEQTGQSSAVTCKECPSGKFSDTRAASECKACAAGNTRTVRARQRRGVYCGTIPGSCGRDRVP